MIRSAPQFRGRFEIKIDPKFRLILPASFREVLRTTSDSRMVVTNSQYQGKRCLDAYPFSEWSQLEKKIAKLPQLKVEVQNFQRFYLSGGHVVDSDAQSRLLIPPTLRTYAGLQSEVVLVGFANKFEIWAQETWAGLFDNLAQDFNQTLAAIAEIKSDE